MSLSRELLKNPYGMGTIYDPVRCIHPCISIENRIRNGSIRTGSIRTGSIRTGSIRTDPIRTEPVRTKTPAICDDPIEMDCEDSDTISDEEKSSGEAILQFWHRSSRFGPFNRRALMMDNNLYSGKTVKCVVNITGINPNDTVYIDAMIVSENLDGLIGLSRSHSKDSNDKNCKVQSRMIVSSDGVGENSFYLHIAKYSAEFKKVRSIVVVEIHKNGSIITRLSFGLYIKSHHFNSRNSDNPRYQQSSISKTFLL